MAAGAPDVVGMATLSMCFTLAQDQMAAKFKLVKERCRMLSPCRRSKDDEEDSDEVDEAETESRAARAVPVQPVTTLTDALRHSPTPEDRAQCNRLRRF